MLVQLPESVQDVVVVEYIYEHQEGGWTARNSNNPFDCVPVLRAVGGGTTKEHLMTIEEALVMSIKRVKLHQQRLAHRLKKLEAALTDVRKEHV